ncbi:PREDICTED: ecdysteroid-regulated 16 kDa protein-like [Nicrophorus vespilloides]|uniref:Ecdysteroid-regulated 16 kDa protein-like n=1 Tax=Nicrophorus vespilloides TaxID=110193 RepID=A0ABM1M9I7_NICVS|nr:PREDICTED: ecdysteroid-regulated 16 kDa protein-like [Nicrophorus vespilloides]
MKYFVFVVAVFGCFVTVPALYSQCKGTKEIENFEDTVQVSGCRKNYCRLQKKTQTQLQMKFTPDKDVKSITNSVTADIAGIPFPFIGTDGTNACNNVFEADGTTKASCPLKAGTEYVYKNVIDVLEIYPQLKVIVHWGLTTPSGETIACFEVPAKITT